MSYQVFYFMMPQQLLRPFRLTAHADKVKNIFHGLFESLRVQSCRCLLLALQLKNFFFLFVACNKICCMHIMRASAS